MLEVLETSVPTERTMILRICFQGVGLRAAGDHFILLVRV